MPSSCYVLFPYNGHYEGGVAKNLIWNYCTEKSVKGFCIEVKKFLVARLIYCMRQSEKSVGNVLSMNNLQVIRDWIFFVG